MNLRRQRGAEPSEFLATDGDVLAWTYYIKLMREGNAMDFNDLLLRCRHLLTTNAIIRRQLMAKIDYLLVDEFQDCNQIQASPFLSLRNLPTSLADGKQGISRVSNVQTKN